MGRRVFRALLAVADHDAAGLDDHHVAALDRAGRGHPPDRDVTPGVEANHRRVLPAPPPLLGLGDVRAPRGHDARVAGEHLVRERRVGLEQVGRHPCLLVRRDELGMLGASGIGIEAVAPLERAPGDHAGRMPAVVLRGTDEDVGEPPVLGIDSPPGAH